MKNSTNWILAAGLIMSGTVSFSQRATETSAALEYKKFQSAQQSQDMETAKKALLKAKEYIDLAAEHPDTKESSKTLNYKGQIYFYSALYQGMGDASFASMPEDLFEQGVAAYKKGYAMKDKNKSAILDAVNENIGIVDLAAVTAYNNKEYKMAVEAYDARILLSDAIGSVDSSAIYFAGAASENAGDFAKAAEYYKRSADIGYNVPDVYKRVANAYIQDKKTEEATAYLAKAIEKSPNDKELYYAIGTFYMEANQNEKATEALKKAVQLDPKYWDAQYQLGAHLQSQGAALRNQANNLKVNDPNYDKMIAESDEYFRQALVPLEAYIAQFPTEKSILLILSQLHRSLKNPEKAAEYKKRADEAK